MTFQFKIQIKHIAKPPVWRVVLVPGQFSFSRFHLVIQEAFGWENYHLYQFSQGGFGERPIIRQAFEDEDGEDFVDASTIEVGDIFKSAGQKFTYMYDFGDSWEHAITLEKVTDDKTVVADCIAGKGKCPPEDCGGPWGYANLLQTLKDPKNPEHDDMKDWLGLDDDEQWDINEFDLNDTSAMVRLV